MGNYNKREILFKAKILETESWIEGSYVSYNDTIVSCGDIKKIDPRTLCQFVGYDGTTWDELSQCQKDVFQQKHELVFQKNTSEWKGHKVWEGSILKGNKHYYAEHGDPIVRIGKFIDIAYRYDEFEDEDPDAFEGYGLYLQGRSWTSAICPSDLKNFKVIGHEVDEKDYFLPDKIEKYELLKTTSVELCKSCKRHRIWNGICSDCPTYKTLTFLHSEIEACKTE